MGSFDEVQFPTTTGFRSTGGPQRQTQVVILGSNAEARNARWTNSRRSWDIVQGQLSMDDLHTIQEFFEARNGRLIGFRFKDWADYKSCGPQTTAAYNDQQIGIGDGVTTTFQLTKTYSSGASSYQRTIYKPVAGTVLIGEGGSELVSGWDIDTTTGIVTFSAAPAYGSLITAGYEFDCAARFDTDQLSIEQTNPGSGIIQSLPILELPRGS